MPQNDIISLKGINFTPVQFKPTEYTGTPINQEPFKQSLDKIEANINASKQTKSSIDAALGEFENKINLQDDNTKKWWADYKRNIDDQIDAKLAFGDYSGAANVAISLAGKVSRDSSIKGRIDSYEDFKKQKEYADNLYRSGKLSERDYNYYTKNKLIYNYDPKLDENGKESTEFAGTHKHYKAAIESVKWEDVVANAVKASNPDTIASSNSGDLKDDKGKVIGSRGSSSSKTILTKEEIDENLNNMLNNSVFSEQIENDKEITLDEYNTLVNKSNRSDAENAKLNTLRMRLFKDGDISKGLNDNIDYIKQSAPALRKNAAYRNINTGSHQNTDTSHASGSSITPKLAGDKNGSKGTNQGPGVKKKSESEE